MDWGLELWDQFDNVDKHLHHTIDFGDRYAKFVKDRCSIEMEYAGKMRKLVKSYQPKRKEEERNMFSTHKAFQSQLSELNDIAGQHETVAEEMMSTISKNAQAFYNELKADKKKLFQDGRHMQVNLEQEERTLEQLKKKFEKEWKECERSQSYFEKLDADSNVTKADVEKAKYIWISKKDSVEACKTDYGAFLQKFNTDQTSHYRDAMPKIFESYRDCDERAILKFKDLMIAYASIDQKVKPIIQKCLEGIDRAANAIDAKLDAELVVERLKSGFVPPTDKEFEDYTSPQHGRANNEEHSDSQRNSLVIGKGNKGKGGFSWLFGQKKPSPVNYIRKQLSTESSIPRSQSVTSVSNNSDGNLSASTSPNNDSEQKSRTLSFTKKPNYEESDTGNSPLTCDKRSASVNLLDQKESVSGETKDNPGVRARAGSEIRLSVTRNKRKLKSMFRMSKAPDTFPKIEVSGPITVDMSGAAMAGEYTDIVRPADESVTENLYDEVPATDSGGAESPDYSHLPPEQRKKKLQKLIEETRKELTKKEDGRKAMLKMQDVYRANTALGDPGLIEGQIKQATIDIDKIQVELSQYEEWYSDATGVVQSSPARGAGTRNTTTNDHHQPQQQQPVKQPLATEPAAKSSAMQREQSFNDDFDEESEPIGTCKAIYDFEANSEGTLSMKIGQEFHVLEADNGDGWTRAMYNDTDGYVPTSYIEVTFFT